VSSAHLRPTRPQAPTRPRAERHVDRPYHDTDTASQLRNAANVTSAYQVAANGARPPRAAGSAPSTYLTHPAVAHPTTAATARFGHRLWSAHGAGSGLTPASHSMRRCRARPVGLVGLGVMLPGFSLSDRMDDHHGAQTGEEVRAAAGSLTATPGSCRECEGVQRQGLARRSPRPTGPCPRWPLSMGWPGIPPIGPDRRRGDVAARSRADEGPGIDETRPAACGGCWKTPVGAARIRG
jgi:hypothetical protein